MTEDEIVGWHHLLNGHGFEQTLGIVKDREAWCGTVHGVEKRRIQLSNRTPSPKFKKPSWPVFTHKPYVLEQVISLSVP